MHYSTLKVKINEDVDKKVDFSHYSTAQLNGLFFLLTLAYVSVSVSVYYVFSLILKVPSRR